MMLLLQASRLVLPRMEQPTYRFPESKRKRKQKWRTSSGGESPFPVPVSSIHGLPASNDRWNYFTGRLVGSCVYIDDTANASSLYQMVVVAVTCVVLLITWTGWTLKMAFLWWQHHKHVLVYHHHHRHHHHHHIVIVSTTKCLLCLSLCLSLCLWHLYSIHLWAIAT